MSDALVNKTTEHPQPDGPRVRKKYNFDKHLKLVTAWGAFDVAKQAHAFGKITNDEALARMEALLVDLDEIAKLETYETVEICGASWAPTHTLSWSVWQKTDGKCTYCDIKLNPFDRLAPDGFQIDHVKPRVQDGPDDIDNLVPSCRTCNGAKSGRTPEEWRASHV